MTGRTKLVCALLLLCSLAISAHQDGPISSSSTDMNSILFSPALNDTDADLHPDSTTATGLRKEAKTPEQSDDASSFPAASLAEMNDEFAQEGFLVVKKIRKRKRKHHASLGNSSRPEHSERVLKNLTFLSEESGKETLPRKETAVRPNERSQGVAQMTQQGEKSLIKHPDPDSAPEYSSEGISDPRSLPPDYTFSEQALKALDFPDSFDKDDSTAQREQQAAPKEELVNNYTALHPPADKASAASTKERIDPESGLLDYTFPEASMAALDFPDGSDLTNQNSGNKAAASSESSASSSPPTTSSVSSWVSSSPSPLNSSLLAPKPEVSDSVAAYHQNDKSVRHVENDELKVPNHVTGSPRGEATTVRTLEKQQMSFSWEESDEMYDDALEVHEESEEYYDDTTKESNNEPWARHRHRRAVAATTTVSGDTTVGIRCLGTLPWKQFE